MTLTDEGLMLYDEAIKKYIEQSKAVNVKDNYESSYVPKSGEICFTTNGQMKIGNGISTYEELNFIGNRLNWGRLGQ